MSRLKKIAELQELNELNMPVDVLNAILQSKETSDTVDEVVYRRLMNSNTKFVVEIWQLAGEKYVVFSGHFQGQWNTNNIDDSEVFESLNQAQLYVQNELQGEAELNQMVVSKRLNNFKKLIANGKEPDYKQLATDFQKEVNVPNVELKHKDHLNKYYDQFQDYMKHYYPEWAQYPAYIWRGWNYFTNNLVDDKDNDKDETTEDQNAEQDTVTENTETTQPADTTTDSSSDLSGDGGGDSQ